MMAKCPNCKQHFEPEPSVAWEHLIEQSCITVHKQMTIERNG